MSAGEQAAPLFDGRYRVVRELGRGGFGRVLLMQDTEHRNRLVALKVLDPGFTDQVFIEYFRREIDVLRDLGHPDIPKILNDRRTPAGEFYFTMEFVDGRSLEDIISKEAPLRMQRILDMLCQLLEVLHHTHRLGVVHRDLKPSNIIIVNPDTDQERVKVLDFGVAKVLDDAPVAPGSRGTIVGTRDYMAPEQVVGDAVDERSDLYAVGVITFRMLTGKFPFEGEDASMRRDRRLEKSALPLDGGIPVEIAQFVSRLLQRERDKRPRTEEACRVAEALNGRKVERRERTDPEPSPTIPKRLVLIASALVLTAAIAFVAIRMWPRASDVVVTARDGSGNVIEGLTVLAGDEVLGVTDAGGEARVRVGRDVRELRCEDRSPQPCYASRASLLQAADRKRGQSDIQVSKDCTVLALSSNPAGAQLRLDGNDRGATPARIEKLAPGKHAVRLTLEGWVTRDTTIELARGEERNVALKLVQVARGGSTSPPKPDVKPVPPRPAFEKSYQISTAPSAAAAFLDGETTSCTDEFGRGTRTLREGLHRFRIRTGQGEVVLEYPVQAGDLNNILVLDFQTRRVVPRR